MNNLELLIPNAPNKGRDWWTWATVTQASPLRIRLDGDTDPLDMTPQSLTGALRIGDRVWVQGNLRSVVVHEKAGGSEFLIPTGSVQMFASTTPPAGWLVCDGSSFLSTQHPRLAALIGDSFGAHVGTTYFLPDFRDKNPMGASATRAFATAGGSFTRQLTAANLPPHAHTINHAHTAITAGPTGGNIEWASGGTAGVTAGATAGARGTGTSSLVTNTYAGSSGNGPGTQAAFDITNPYLAMPFIIKT